MSVQLTCDLCGKDVKELGEFGTLSPNYQVADRIKHVCKKCFKKVNEQVQRFSQYYERELAKDMREWLLESCYKKEAFPS